MSKRPSFFVKMSVTELKAHSIKYVVGNGRSAFWAMTANLLYLALTWESNHIISFLTAWIGFMPSSFCNYINSSTWYGQTLLASTFKQERLGYPRRKSHWLQVIVSSVELLRQLGKVFGDDSQGFVGRFTLSEVRELANVTSRNMWAPEGQFRDESTDFGLAVHQSLLRTLEFLV